MNDSTHDRRSTDSQIGYLTSQVEMLAERVGKLTEKVEALTEMKNKGLGILLSVALLWGVVANWAVEWLKNHVKF